MIRKRIRDLCTDYQKIENYEQAINDKENMWICHHRREIDEGLSSKELQDLNLYMHRPPEELIFLKFEDHKKLHDEDYWTDDHRAEQGERQSNNWKDPEYRQKQKDSWTEERLSTSSETQRIIQLERYKDPAVRKKTSEAVTEWWAKRRANGTAKWSKNLNK